MTTSISNIIKGIIISFITTIIFLLIFSVILTYTNISENFITPTIIVMTAISIFIGNSKIQRNGLLNGAIVGGIYLISIYLLSSIINQKFALSMQSIVMIISGIVCGMFGGILGVNKSR